MDGGQGGQPQGEPLRGSALPGFALSAAFKRVRGQGKVVLRVAG